MTMAGPEGKVGAAVPGVPDEFGELGAPVTVSEGVGVADLGGASDGVGLPDAEGGGVGDVSGVEPGVHAARDPSRSSARRCAQR
jgi:hypothetical protein